MRPPNGQFGTLARPLDNILGTQAKVRVLRALEVSEGPQTLLGLQQATALTYAGAQRAVNPLVDAGIVSELPTVGARLFKFATEHPFAAALSVLFEAERRRAQAISAIIDTWAAQRRHGLLAIWLFGSVARREDTFRSDVDIALVAKTDDEALTLAHELRTAMETVAAEFTLRPNVVPFSAVAVGEMAATNDPMWSELVKDALPLYGARPESLLNQIVHGNGGTHLSPRNREKTQKKS